MKSETAFQRTTVWQLTLKSGPSRAGNEMRKQRWLFSGILNNCFNLYCQIYYLEAHEYEKVNQAFLLSTKLLLYESHLDLYVFCSLKSLFVLSSY